MEAHDDETLQHIKDVTLLILKDFKEICEENNLKYYLWFGTEIGAVRHQGFIPWDDDIDIVMFREDYEKFLKIMEEKNCEKYTVLDSRYNEEYFFQFGRLSLNGTHWVEFWDKFVSFDLGMHIDLFILDKLPNNNIKRFFFMRICLILCKFYAISTIKFDEGSKIVQLIVNTLHPIFNVIGLTPSYFQKKLPKLFRKYENKDCKYYADLTLNYLSYFKLSDFEPSKVVQFEDIQATIPNNQDATLGQIYGDYMTLPPEEDRFWHNLHDIDFGEY
ncbi:hypothetical protein TL18_06840 [Methanobrevibacter sp. YE315]|uniref:LicD family protein n=1 Tax=Methanobrevibacter sp. YE315 TaxID=1609968 RepID=UPI000764E772|nr:LicD family protein [Methanobrevibacter sp. YE315]AMD17757.1 hypothetical protein TL18_06840 [Methanobrevibacter sp. YE315]